jgi:hypothetical protein
MKISAAKDLASEPKDRCMSSQPTKTRPSTLQIIWSMIAAFCGVQNYSNHDRDDAYIEEVGFRPYIIGGIVLTLAVIAGLWLIVRLILN